MRGARYRVFAERDTLTEITSLRHDRPAGGNPNAYNGLSNFAQGFSRRDRLTDFALLKELYRSAYFKS